MSKGQSLQDPFLNALRRERVPVSIYLVNGIKLQGVIESFDQFVVLLRNTVSQMVYKHAISTVVPARNVRVGPGGGVVQATTVGTAADGTPVRIPTCLVVTLRDGKIARFEEYADSRAAEALFS